MEPLDEDTPPFWSQSVAINRSRRRQSTPSPLFNPVLLIVFLPIVFFLLVFLFLPPFLTFCSQIFKPSNHSVKKSWDSLNIFLLLFVVLCGILARMNDDGSSNDSGRDDEKNLNSMKLGRVVSNQWFDNRFSEREQERNDVNRFKRSGSSYPDLREEPVQVNGGDEQFRFFDDFDINRYRRLETNVPVHRRRRSMGDLSELKDAPVDKFVVSSSAVSSPVTTPAKNPVLSTSPVIPPPTPSSPVRKPRKITYRTVSRKDQTEAIKRARSPPATAPPPPAPPPPPPPAVTIRRSEVKYVNVERKKSNTTTTSTTKEIKSVLASIYKQGKRKKKQKMKVIIDDSLLSQSTSLNPEIRSSATAPVPPPPPPPLPAVFNLFKKSSKSKKVYSVPPAPPSPPRSRSSIAQSMNRQNEISPDLVPSPSPVNASRRHYNSTSIGRPPMPNRINSLNDVDENQKSGGQSPLIPMPPPPLPPFRMKAMKFTVKGDYVRVQSGPSTRCSSPELDDVVDQSSSTKEEEPSNIVINGGDDGGGGGGGGVVQQSSSVFCPSPDVNMKADTFIARLRDEWKHEKMKSLKGKQKLGQLH